MDPTQLESIDEEDKGGEKDEDDGDMKDGNDGDKEDQEAKEYTM